MATKRISNKNAKEAAERIDLYAQLKLFGTDE